MYSAHVAALGAAYAAVFDKAVFKELTMGCDIHWVLERKHEDKWVGVNTSSGGVRPRIEVYSSDKKVPPISTTSYYDSVGNRNYQFFTAIANVRGEGGMDPKGVPLDVSDLAQMEISNWGEDGHSHTYMPLVDFCKAWITSRYANYLAHVTEKLQGKNPDPVETLFGPYAEDPEEFRVVVWFDN